MRLGSAMLGQFEEETGMNGYGAFLLKKNFLPN
jgi:hypothetical protein